MGNEMVKGFSLSWKENTFGKPDTRGEGGYFGTLLENLLQLYNVPIVECRVSQADIDVTRSHSGKYS